MSFLIKTLLDHSAITFKLVKHVLRFQLRYKSKIIISHYYHSHKVKNILMAH